MLSSGCTQNFNKFLSRKEFSWIREYFRKDVTSSGGIEKDKIWKTGKERAKETSPQFHCEKNDCHVQRALGTQLNKVKQKKKNWPNFPVSQLHLEIHQNTEAKTAHKNIQRQHLVLCFCFPQCWTVLYFKSILYIESQSIYMMYISHFNLKR